ncbi:hypothetical protein N3356_002025 [Micrococcus luteus]|nr:hypothetical protein [Micrococcus luteus]
MDRARSIHTGQTWTAADFQHASDDIKALHRSEGNGFRCVDCDGEAWFVRRSADRSAKFAGRHRDGCEQGGGAMDTLPADGVRPVRTRENHGEVLQPRLDGLIGASWTSPRLRDAEDREPGASPARRHITQPSGRGGNRSVGLRALHGHVLTDPSYAQSDRLINVPGRGEARMRDAIHHAAVLPQTALGTHCFVWGEVTTVNHTSAEPPHWFLNVRSGTDRLFAFHMSAAIAKAVVEAMNHQRGLRWQSLFDAVEAQFMVFGHLKVAKNGVPMMSVKELSHLSLRVP